MPGFNTVDEILDFAIGQEEKAVQIYTNLADRTEDARMQRILEGYADEERGHKAKLLAIRHGKNLMPEAKEVTDLDIADYLPDVEPSPDLDYMETLTLAMKAEKAAFKLYSDLAEMAEDEEVRATLLSLAQEEAKHKLRFEVEYDERTVRLAPHPEI
jgi:rubrerythrin